MEPLENATLIFDLHIISEDVTKIPELILPLFRINNQSDSNGNIQINSIQFNSGISSVYFIRPILIYPFANLSDLNLSSTLTDVIDLIQNPDQRYGLSLSSYTSFIDGLLALSQEGIIGYCFGDMINFTLVSKVGSILLMNKTQTNSRFSLNVEYYFRIKMYSLQNTPLINTAVNIDFKLVHFPSYLICDYISKTETDFKKMLIKYNQMSNSTDGNGEILLKF